LRLLVVEDDDHKVQDIQELMGNTFPKAELDLAMSVRDGVLQLQKNSPDLLLLDMALPTFEKRGTNVGGTDQAQGGLELVRFIHELKLSAKVIILTQYPDIEVEDKFYSLDEAGAVLSKRYNCQLVGIVHYKFRSDDWKQPLIELIRSVECA
jgi:CheY-like chemotaxis protein